MVEFIFTLDYEIYGNGSGTLRELVLDPTEQLAEIFNEFGVPFVVFAEAVEFDKIEQAQSDADIAGVARQMRDLRSRGHEIALHLHPWWANGNYAGGRWHLDWNERNISTLAEDRVRSIVDAAIRYLRRALKDADYTPVAFRSGLWAMQPAGVIAKVLALHGIRIDSSVFKGGRIASLQLDYRPALHNGDSWRFSSDVNNPDPYGPLTEIPIHTEMVPSWAMLGSKRLALQKKAKNANYGSPLPRRWSDFLRFRFPRKLDFCRMTFDELRTATEKALERVQEHPERKHTLVAIGHSKDFVDSESCRKFLAFLREHSVEVTTFERLYCKELEFS